MKGDDDADSEVIAALPPPAASVVAGSEEDGEREDLILRPLTSEPDDVPAVSGDGWNHENLLPIDTTVRPRCYPIHPLSGLHSPQSMVAPSGRQG